MGTPDFAVPCLERLVKDGYDVCCVVTQPDKSQGRKQILTPSDVKVCAMKHGIEVYQPQTLRSEEAYEYLKSFGADYFIVAAYGKILPKNILDLPKYACINVHGSLLPKYRGAAPIQRSVLAGDKVTGITTMLMGEGLDTGDMLLREEIAIEENDNFEDIHDKLGACGAELIVRTLDDIENGSAVRTPQDGSLATYAAKITKEDCLLNFNTDAKSVHDLIRGLSPIPLSFTHTADGKLLKVTEARICERESANDTPGKVLSLGGGITVACARGSVTFIGVLPEGNSRMSAEAFVRGRKVNIGDILK